MITILTKIFTNIVTTIYQYIWFALLAAVLFMFLYLFAGEHGWKESFKVWLGSFRRRSAFRRVFLLALYMILVLFRTLLNRELWLNPLSDIFGGWGLYTENGVFTTEAIEIFSSCFHLFCCFSGLRAHMSMERETDAFLWCGPG